MITKKLLDLETEWSQCLEGAARRLDDEIHRMVQVGIGCRESEMSDSAQKAGSDAVRSLVEEKLGDLRYSVVTSMIRENDVMRLEIKRPRIKEKRKKEKKTKHYSCSKW